MYICKHGVTISVLFTCTHKLVYVNQIMARHQMMPKTLSLYVMCSVISFHPLTPYTLKLVTFPYNSYL